MDMHVFYRNIQIQMYIFIIAHHNFSKSVCFILQVPEQCHDVVSDMLICQALQTEEYCKRLFIRSVSIFVVLVDKLIHKNKNTVT
jgi:hypothetical protein